MPSPALGSRHGGTPRRAGRSILVALLVIIPTVVMILAAVPRIPQLAQAVRLVPPDDPYVALDRDITAEFGMQNPVVWVIEAREGTVWTPVLLARILALTRDVFTIPGIIAPDVVSLASPNLRDLRVTEGALEPVYLMAEVPPTPEAIAALRRRVDNDPNYRGTLLSEDGRAAMVVANFRDGADPQTVARAALALRDRYTDAQAAVYVVGAPVLGAIVPQAVRPVALGFLLVLATGLVVLAVAGGMRVALAAALAAVLAPLWATAIIIAVGRAVLPWTGYAALVTALIAAAMTTARGGSSRARLLVAAALLLGCVAFAVCARAPGAAFGVAGALGSAAAIAASQAMRSITSCESGPRREARAARVVALGMLALALVGLPRLRASFGMFGYGERYLPERAVADLRGLARHFPPPSALAIRFRGEPGFVELPDVLRAFDGLAGAVRDDPAVVRALSLADLVKMVHRAFNDNRDEFLAIPGERGLIARYLALAYSPGFRRFVDRAFTRSVLWVYLGSDRSADLARVLSTLEFQLAAHPVPRAQADVAGGDGAVVLAAAQVARQLCTGAAAFLFVLAAGVALLCGRTASARALLGGAGAAAAAAGACAWFAVPLDLVSLPCVIAAGMVGAASGALGDIGELGVALAAMALVAFGASFVGANGLGVVVGVLLGAPALASRLGFQRPDQRPSGQTASAASSPL